MAKKFYAQDLAELHSLHYSDFVEKAAPGTLAALRDAGIRTGVVLDLGCGGGQLSLRLLLEGFEPVGIDVSSAMIRLARQRAPKAKFICGSVAQIALPPCAAAIAIGEVFNYLPSKSAIQRAFRSVFRSLKPGGVLVFDAKEQLPGPGKKTVAHARWGAGWAIFAETTEDPRRQKLVRRIVSFSKDGKLYRRDEEVHRQIILEAAKVAALLTAIGFAVDVFPGYKTFRVSDDRKVFVARKPA
jgi:SAM-dependent methyltransferase